MKHLQMWGKIYASSISNLLKNTIPQYCSKDINLQSNFLQDKFSL